MLMLLSVHMTSVLFLVWFNNFTLTMGVIHFYSSRPFLCALAWKKAHLSHPLHRMQYGHYQILSAALGWLGDGDCYLIKGIDWYAIIRLVFPVWGWDVGTRLIGNLTCFNRESCAPTTNLTLREGFPVGTLPCVLWPALALLNNLIKTKPSLFLTKSRVVDFLYVPMASHKSFPSHYQSFLLPW